ncbi:DNA-processing protein DprA [Rhodothermus profundi]|uniref:DNA protecting protein DprA n=1 Tax=Rhodothermus profundi TaxID=633813 RepID=A0A1M6PNS1_9BACT|nr:DNA-processing protein DprA [Rhodothermus profundi]SHK09547.1 DNA protecting protein DprA [Rhodothermus profundi]
MPFVKDDEAALGKVPDNPSEELRALVALTLVPGVGSGRIRALLARFGSAQRVLYASIAELMQVPGIGMQTAQRIVAFDDWDAVDMQFEQAERVGATLIPAWDERFPPLLRTIYDPPALLWMRGTWTPEDHHAVAIVGTRRPTDYGLRTARQFAAALAREGVTVISGLAYGIDAAAHRGALEAGGRTLAVLGSGVDRIYPARHERLARAILNQGALFSEFPLGAAPDAPNFPRRNRLISGLARAVLIVEAYETGGALITARLALEQNREVLAIPGVLHNPASAGTNRLIRDSLARLVCTPDDVLEAIGFGASPVAQPPPSPPSLNGLERQLYDALEPEPLHIDVLCERTGLDPSTALVYLLQLEFKGLVRQLAGKQFYRL